MSSPSDVPPRIVPPPRRRAARTRAAQRQLQPARGGDPEPPIDGSAVSTGGAFGATVAVAAEVAVTEALTIVAVTAALMDDASAR